jgi:mRNA interferase MazF
MKSPTITRGEIWLVEFDPARGAEIQKTRPAVVIDVDAVGVLPLRLIAPITDWKPVFSRAPWFVHILPDSQNGLTKESGIDAFQITSASEQRFKRRLGHVTSAQLTQVVKAVALCIGFPS